MEYMTVIVVAVYTIPIGWLFYLTNKTSRRVDDLQKTSYTKKETTEMIELHNRPILQAVEGLKEDITEIKQLLGKLFDAQQSKK